MHQYIFEFPILDSNSVHKLKTTGNMKLVDRRLDMIRMYT